jgi:hypothetical protein
VNTPGIRVRVKKEVAVLALFLFPIAIISGVIFSV